MLFTSNLSLLFFNVGCVRILISFYWISCAFFFIRRPKTHRGKRVIEQRAPKDVENTKTALFIRGGRTSETVTQAMKDLVSYRKGGLNLSLGEM